MSSEFFTESTNTTPPEHKGKGIVKNMPINRERLSHISRLPQNCLRIQIEHTV